MFKSKTCGFRDNKEVRMLSWCRVVMFWGVGWARVYSSPVELIHISMSLEKCCVSVTQPVHNNSCSLSFRRKSFWPREINIYSTKITKKITVGKSKGYVWIENTYFVYLQTDMKEWTTPEVVTQADKANILLGSCDTGI